MSKDGRLLGKKALVTGSGTGIGREVALEFARQGADVVLHYAHAMQGVEAAVAEIQAMGRKAAVFKADFDRVDEVLQLADHAIGFLGRVDCLINNAGITFNRPFGRVTLEQYDRLYHVNVRAQFFLTQRIAEEMLKHGGGAVVNVTSIHGVSVRPSTRSMPARRGRSSLTPARWGSNWPTREFASTPSPPAVSPWKTTPRSWADSIPWRPPNGPRTPFPSDTWERRWTSAGSPFSFAARMPSSSSARTIVADGGTTSLMSLISDFRNESSARFGVGYLPGV